MSYLGRSENFNKADTKFLSLIEVIKIYQGFSANFDQSQLRHQDHKDLIKFSKV